MMTPSVQLPNRRLVDKVLNMIFSGNVQFIKVRPYRYEVFLSGDCLNPYLIELTGRDSVDQFDREVLLQGSASNPTFVDLYVRCRRCETCRANTYRRWYARTMQEMMISQKAYLVTPTFNGEHRNEINVGAVLRMIGDDDLTEWGALNKASYEFVKKAFKRVRSRNKRESRPVTLRYLAVSEAHEDGFPHYHILIFADKRYGLNDCLFTEFVKMGRTTVDLVKDPQRQVGYCLKYILKSGQHSIRASLNFGSRNLLDGIREEENGNYQPTPKPASNEWNAYEEIAHGISEVFEVETGNR